MISCLVCQRTFSMITNTHLKSHALTTDKYLELYPGANLVDEAERLRASAHAKKHNKPGQSRPGVGEKIKETRSLRKAQGVDYGKALRGVTKTEETKQKLSASAINAYQSGTRTHWASGITQGI